MTVLQQNVVNGQNIPRQLEWNLFNTPTEFSVAIVKAIHQTPPPVIGVSVLLSEEGTLEAAAFAILDRVLVLYPRGTIRTKGFFSKEDPLAGLLHGLKIPLVGFGMARLVVHIKHGLNAHARGFELSDVCAGMKGPLTPGEFVKVFIDNSVESFLVNALWDAFPPELANDPRRFEFLCLRAWLSARVGGHPPLAQALRNYSPLDTIWLSNKHFDPLYQMIVEVERMDAAKSRSTQSEFSSVDRNAEGKLVINNERFTTRVRASKNTRIVAIDDVGHEYHGLATGSSGRKTIVTPVRSTGSRKITQVHVFGKEELNNAERAREEFIRQLLQGKRVLDDPAFELIQKLYFPGAQGAAHRKVVGSKIRGRLNQSQADVVEAMVNSDAPFIVTHGPPGTGKTSTISFAVQDWIRLRTTAWVVAQSNIGVKNIAERLCKDHVNFRLIVSQEFYFEWHEHIYEAKVKELMIITSNLRNVAETLQGVSVVLCTISTLSSPAIAQKRVFDLVPVANLVVDEASQINIFDYLPILAQFKRLRKVCFFGDPKQLPPFGQDVAPTLKCIFDIQHLKLQAYFLNTQYRMPVPLGNFISSAVYDSRLQSEHQIYSPSCLTFIDASLGEEESVGTSWKNIREIQSVIHLVRDYYGKKPEGYCVLTPYDAQRSALQDALKGARLRWDNVFNVDSYQGNETDFVIISVVRTTSPGFLDSWNRMNVMLTRCRMGLVIVTNRLFMEQKSVDNTLLGKLRLHWEKKSVCGRDGAWRDWKAVANSTADLPGAPGRNRGAHFSPMHRAPASFRPSAFQPIVNQIVDAITPRLQNSVPRSRN